MDGRLKDVHRLMRKIDRLTDGQASVDQESVDWEQAKPLESFLLIIRPNGGPYKGGKFEFRGYKVNWALVKYLLGAQGCGIALRLAHQCQDNGLVEYWLKKVSLPFDYPSSCPPVVWCNTQIYHPNFDMDEQQYFDDSSTNVCLNLLDYGSWHESYTLEVMVLGLLFLFHHPNLDDPLASGFRGLETEEEFGINVRKYMAGEEVDGVKYETDFRVVDGVLVEEGLLKKRRTGENLESGSVKEVILDGGHGGNKCNDMNTLEISEGGEKPTVNTVIDDIRDINYNYSGDNNKDEDDVCPTIEETFINTQIGKVQKHGETIIKKGEDSANESLGTMAKIKDDTPVYTEQTNEKMDTMNVLKFESKCGNLPQDIKLNVAGGDDDKDELNIEFVCVDGEYILKPKDIHVEETGIKPKQKELYDDWDSDESFSEGFVEKDSSKTSPSCLRAICHILSRIFRPCRK